MTIASDDDADPRVRAAPDLQVLQNAEALMQAAAELFVHCGVEAMRTTGRFVIALSGGSTPTSVYALLASAAYAGRLDWARVHVFWGDERCVPPDHPASNYRMARQSLLDYVPAAEENIHRIRGEDDPVEAAAAYERELRATFATPGGAPRSTPGARFDLVLLGLGTDGHTASLFPGATAVSETRRWVVAHQVAAPAPWRITLTPLVINAAATILFLVAGREKSAIVRRVIQGPYQPDTLPAQAIAPHAGRLRWLVDAAAAAELRQS